MPTNSNTHTFSLTHTHTHTRLRTHSHRSRAREYAQRAARACESISVSAREYTQEGAARGAANRRQHHAEECSQKTSSHVHELELGLMSLTEICPRTTISLSLMVVLNTGQTAAHIFASRRDGRERVAGERATQSSAVPAKCQTRARRRLAGHLLRSAVLVMSGYLGLSSRKRRATGRIRVHARASHIKFSPPLWPSLSLSRSTVFHSWRAERAGLK